MYFDEGTGETLTKSEWESKEAGLDEDVTAEASADKDGLEPETAKESKESKEKLAAIGSSKKRKAGKVVGADGDEEGPVEPKKSPAPKQGEKKAEKGKSAKKGKKIKLSFGDDE